MTIKVAHRRLYGKSAMKMLVIFLISLLTISAHCIPLEPEESKPQIINDENSPKQISPEEKINQPQNSESPVPEVSDGASLPSDLSDSADANPINQPGTVDLDTDATFWGWGYRRPYYYRSYYSPWRRWGWGRGYGGWGWGRGWGWPSYYW